MKEIIKKYFDDERYALKTFLIISFFLIIIKLPAIISSDIQPWDEGMYATRSLSIAESGDFFDQTSHSVGKFYSSSHPPLLIWIGYIFGSILGFNNIVLKSIIFVFAIGCIGIIILMGINFFNQRTGVLASLIFSSNIIFNVFSKRFQFDIPFIFLTLLCFYFIMKYLQTNNKKYNYYAGIFFGLFLMLKILVGFFIPLVMFLTLILGNKKIHYSFKDLFQLTIIGLIIALPWHIFMFLMHGKDFINYFFFFHIYERALHGVEGNVKHSSFLYYVNYLFTIIPFSILIYYSFYKFITKYKEMSEYNILLFVWFITGFLIITSFVTKLEVYVLLVLAPGVFLISLALDFLKMEKTILKLLILFLTLLNFAWMIINTWRIEVNHNILKEINPVYYMGILFVFIVIIIFSGYNRKKLRLKYFYEILIILFFIFNNLRYAIAIPEWENNFKISSIKKEIENSEIKNLVYVASNYRHNPQFSFYFEGLDLNWNNQKYNFIFLDTKNGINNVYDSLNKITGKVNVIIERDNINRTYYPASDSIIGYPYHLVMKSKGYELYRK